LAYFPKPFISMAEWEVIAASISNSEQDELEKLLLGYCDSLEDQEREYVEIIKKLDSYIDELKSPITEDRAQEISRDLKRLDPVFR